MQQKGSVSCVTERTVQERLVNHVKMKPTLPLERRTREIQLDGKWIDRGMRGEHPLFKMTDRFRQEQNIWFKHHCPCFSETLNWPLCLKERASLSCFFIYVKLYDFHNQLVHYNKKEKQNSVPSSVLSVTCFNFHFK